MLAVASWASARLGAASRTESALAITAARMRRRRRKLSNMVRTLERPKLVARAGGGRHECMKTSWRGRDDRGVALAGGGPKGRADFHRPLSTRMDLFHVDM